MLGTYLASLISRWQLFQGEIGTERDLGRGGQDMVHK